MKLAPCFLLLFFLLGRSPIPATAEGTSSFYIDEALVHHVAPSNKQSEFPVIMIPGMNLSSYIYLTTPDGREGWAQHFAAAGYEVFVINDPRFDFSRGFSVPGFQDVPTEGSPPANDDAEQGWQRDIWSRWGFGPSVGNPYPDAQFPTKNFDEFAKNHPYLSTSNSRFAESLTALLEQVGPAILLAHSAAGPQAVAAANAHPELTVGLVLIEPTGPPTEADFPRLSEISMLGVYGDYIESRRQSGRKAGVEAAATLFEQNGGVGEVLSLPDDHGEKGNSHLMMQDKNNVLISRLILNWLGENAKPPKPGAIGGAGPNPPSTGKGARKGGGKGGFMGGAKSRGKAGGKGGRFRRGHPEEG